MPDLIDLTELNRTDLDSILRRSGEWKRGTIRSTLLPVRPRVATIFTGPAFRTRPRSTPPSTTSAATGWTYRSR